MELDPGLFLSSLVLVRMPLQAQLLVGRLDLCLSCGLEKKKKSRKIIYKERKKPKIEQRKKEKGKERKGKRKGKERERKEKKRKEKKRKEKKRKNSPYLINPQDLIRIERHSFRDLLL